MTRPDLRDKIAEKFGLSKKDAMEVVDTVLGEIKQAIKKGEKVTLVGFGTFQKRKQGPSKRKHPQDSSKTINVPAKWVPRFKASRQFKDLLNTKR